ncbi:MAG: PLP-dependent aminotransferase family protein [Gemmatimonadota bacterium]
MPKRTTTLELVLPAREPGVSAARWLVGSLRAEILGGRLRPGSRLPATRDLARQYGLSRGTLVSAFERLKSEGYIEGSIGSGTFVSEVLPDDLLQVARRADAPPVPKRGRDRRLSAFARRVQLFPGYTIRPVRAFRANHPALDLFPTTLWAQVAARRLRRATTQLLLGTDPMGYRPLQEVVADYLRTSRGVQCQPEQIAIVSGVQEALDVVARLVLDPGDRVCMEHPGYPGAALVFEAYGARIDSIAIDEEGMQLPGPRSRNAKLVYLTPGHQFPLGIGMSLRRRLALLEWARSSRALIVEDDYDSEYRYAGRPLPAMQGLDRHGLVLFVGSFSKVLFPSLRLGYLVVPTDLLAQVEATQSISNRHAPLLAQAVLADFIAEGHFGRHLRRMRQTYAERLGVLLEGAGQQLGGLLEISKVEAGLQTAGWLPEGVRAITVAAGAAARGVDVIPLDSYARRALPREGLQLGFAAVDVQELRRGIDQLALVLEAELRGARYRRR